MPACYTAGRNKGGICMESYTVDIIWKDRKRYFGLPISFTKYSLSAERVFVTKGLIKTPYEQTMLYRVVDVKCSITLWQRFFGVGTITVMSSDKTMPNLVLKNIKNPVEVKELLHAQVEEIKLKRRVRIGEIMGDGLDEDDPDKEY